MNVERMLTGDMGTDEGANFVIAHEYLTYILKLIEIKIKIILAIKVHQEQGRFASSKNILLFLYFFLDGFDDLMRSFDEVKAHCCVRDHGDYGRSQARCSYCQLHLQTLPVLMDEDINEMGTVWVG